MEKTNGLKYLKIITGVFISLYALFILLSFLEAIWHGVLQFGNGELYSLIPIKNHEGRIHFWANVFNYILHIVFLLVMNRFVKKSNRGQGYYFVIVLVAFIPLVNYVLFYMIWRELNKQLFIRSGKDWRKPDWKIRVIWILDVLSILYLIIVPLLIYFASSPELVSGIQYFSGFGMFAGKICYLVISIIYLLYFLELKRALNTCESRTDDLKETTLLDN